MSENNIEKLQQILARDNELRSAKEKQVSDQAAIMKQAEADWTNHITNTLLPSFKETEAVLQKGGWITKAEKTPRGFKLSIHRGDMATYQSRERPYLLFELQKSYDTVALTVGTPSSIGMEGDGFTSTNLTPDRLNECVVRLVERLAMK